MERRLIASIGKGPVVSAGWEEIDLDEPSEITVPGAVFPAFAFGKLTATRGVTARVPPGEVSQAFGRHGLCQWGLVSAEQQTANRLAVASGGPILSGHLSSGHVRFDLLTNAERTLTIAHVWKSETTNPSSDSRSAESRLRSGRTIATQTCGTRSPSRGGTEMRSSRKPRRTSASRICPSLNG